jgi:hypothetical protein
MTSGLDKAISFAQQFNSVDCPAINFEGVNKKSNLPLISPWHMQHRFWVQDEMIFVILSPQGSRSNGTYLLGPVRFGKGHFLCVLASDLLCKQTNTVTHCCTFQ